MSEKPNEQALTPREWECLRWEDYDRTVYVDDGALVVHPGYRNWFDAEGRHKLAALALHDHPAGFSWDDLHALEALYRRVLAIPEPLGPDVSAAVERVYALADRIAVLLPPEPR